MTGSEKQDLRRLALRFVGEVQGVGFRWTTKRIANNLRLSGWVRNEWDGSVRMELQGPSDKIAAFFGQLNNAWGRFAPTYVIDQRDDIEPVEGEDGFRVRF